VLKDELWILSLLAVKNTLYLAGESLVAKIEGETLSRLPPRNLPLGTWRGIAVDKQGSLWAVGDAGIVRLTPR
jgi:hypothetical protein